MDASAGKAVAAGQFSGAVPRRDAGMPAFFDDAPTLTVRDPLAQFLGAADGGTMQYTYADVVRLAGHSCPTVAGAYLMTLHGLRALYGDEVPERGNIEVFMRDAPDSGTTGVIATVVQLLTGAASETGFHGIGPTGRFGRYQLLNFGDPMIGTLALRRRDNGAAVQVEMNAAVVPWPDEMRALMPNVVTGRATPADERRFGELWQDRVRRMLIDHADDPQLIEIGDWSQAH